MELHIKKFGDRHRFTFLSNGPKKGDWLSCGRCGVPIWNGKPAYSCRGCNYGLHKSCAEFPQRMVHPFHPQHSLLLSEASYDESGTYFCDACGEERSALAFRCSKCEFDLDLECASFRVIKSTDTTTITTTEISADQLPSSNGHPHPLLLCEKDNNITYRSCSCCRQSIEGSFYVCLECKVLLDKRCAELPMEIQNHPFHPQHRLSLSPNNGDHDSFWCSASGRTKNNQFAYKCSECKFYLDVECASLTVIKPTMITTAITISEEEKSHFQLASTSSHPHPLFLCTSKDNNLSDICCSHFCSFCELPVETSFVFVCIECQLLLHPTCAEFPQEINHPFHPQHPLLIKRRTTFRCSACQGNLYQRGEWAYECSDCNFSLDIGCASLIVTSTTEFFKDERSQIQLSSSGHPHPLFLCTTQGNDLDLLDRRCPYCDLTIEGSSAFVCLECHLTMHPACAEFPIEINHPFHPQHPLSFQLIERDYYCSACGGIVQNRGFVCTVCRFSLHVDCSSLMPANMLSNSCSRVNYQQFQLQQHQLRHPHPLTLCENEKNHQFNCHACTRPFKVGDDDEEEDTSSIYACSECEILLHKSCADLPREIMHHPFHPKHVLKLHDKGGGVKCHACGRLHQPGSFQLRQPGSFYVCDSHTVQRNFTKPCGYAVHITCIWPNPCTIKLDFHKHPLVVFDRGVHNNRCKKCEERCTPPYFKCGECIQYNLHLSCSPILPLSIKHEDHVHSLTLTASRVADQDEDIEFFCDSCEDSIDESDRSYSCPQCLNYDAHIKCVSSTVITTLLTENESGPCAYGDATLDMSSRAIELNTNDNLPVDSKVIASEDSSIVASKKIEANN